MLSLGRPDQMGMVQMSLHERATIWAAFATVKRVLGSLPRELKPATVALLDKYLDDMDADMLRRVEVGRPSAREFVGMRCRVESVRDRRSVRGKAPYNRSDLR